MMEKKKYELEFYGGKLVGLLPLIIMVAFAIYFFGFAGVYDTTALALGGVVALMLSSFLAKKMKSFWGAAISGMADELGNTVALILFIVGVFGKMMTRGHIAQGFIWIGAELHIGPSVICAFAFIITAIIATSTGTSIGTTLTMVPILLPVGAIMGANVVMVAGAILSGALFGDSIGPVSDVTIASSQTQKYKSGNLPDISGVVKSRLKYSLTAAAFTIVFFLFFGGKGTGIDPAESMKIMQEYSDPKGLLMMIPMVVLLAVAFKTRNIFIAGTVGTVVGAIVGIISGIMIPADILLVKDGAMSGFIIDGITNMIGTVAAVYMIVAIIGILKACGMMDSLVSVLSGKKEESSMATEMKISFGTALTSLLIGTMNGPACLMFGPIADEVGQKAKLHPYRRANLIACFSTTLPALSPVSSVYIILAMGGITATIKDYDFIDSISPMQLPMGMFFCLAFPLVFIVSMITGWGREYEGPNDTVVKKREDAI